MNITQNIALDLTKRSVFQYVSAKQGDNSSRLVKITLTNNGEIYQVPKGVGANFRAQKPDGTMILNQAVINDDGTVTVELTQQTLAVCGDVIADVYLTDGSGSVLSSVSFVIHVEAAPMGDKVDSENEFLTLISLAERAEHAANTSASASTTAVKSAQQAEAASRTAVESCARAEAASETAVESCARAEAAAETAAEALTSAKQSCTDAGNSAQTAAQAAQRAEAAKAGAVEAKTAAEESAATATQAASNATSAAERAAQAASEAGDKLPLAGGTMQGAIDMGGQALTGLKAPAENTDALPMGAAKELFVPKEGGHYVVDAGESGGWNYRLWENGFAECWTKNEQQITGSAPTPVMGGYLTTVTVQLPISFVTGTANAVINAKNSTGVGFGNGAVIGGNQLRVNCTGNSNSNGIRYQAYITGEWR